MIKTDIEDTDFSSLNHHSAFIKLMKIVTKFLERIKFSSIRQACIFYITSPDVLQYSSEEGFVHRVAMSKELDDLISILSYYGYLNWFDTRLLKAMVDASDVIKVIEALERYNGHTSRMKLDETFESLPMIDLFPSSKYSTVVKKFDKSLSDLTVGDVRKFQYQLEKLAQTADIKMPKIKTGCVEILWLVPEKCISQLYNSTLISYYQFDTFMHLKCGNLPAIFSPRYAQSKVISIGTSVSQKLFA